VSAELNMEGALKAYIGASSPERIAAHLTLDGGLHIDVGPDAEGNAITIVRRGAIKYRIDGVPNENDVAEEVEVRGTVSKAISGAEVKNINGQKSTQVSGMDQLRCDKRNVNAFGGYTLNAGGVNVLASDKSQYNYALAVLENIVAGGKVSTILAGGKVTTVAAGAYANTVAAGAYSVAAGAGAITSTAGLGLTQTAGAALSQTAGGAMAMTAGAAVSLTAAAAMTLTAAAATTVTSPVVAVGAGAVLGVLRAIPSLPAGTPTLCFITGLPLLGAATVTSA
jgi:hypothetical protein